MAAAQFATNATPDAEGARLLAVMEAWIVDHQAADFDELALEVFAWQFQRLPAYRRFCEGRRARPEQIAHWSQVPMVPITAFRHQVFTTAPARVIFRSSGTTGGPAERSAHHHPFPELYRQVIGRLFAPACLPGDPSVRRPLLSLIPTPTQMPDSSLAFLVDEVFCRHGQTSSATAFGPEGVDAEAADLFCQAAVTSGEAVTLLATSFALAYWLEQSPHSWRLPAGSTLFETGGFKGRHRELPATELARWVEERLGLPRHCQIREYGMTELTSHFYTAALVGGDPDLFCLPPWVRVRALHPETLDPVPAGEVGMLAFFDLANLGSVAHLLTQDLGYQVGPDQFRMAGRATGAALRGCSLTTEELRRA